MKRTYLHDNPDGSPHYQFDLEPGDDHVILTGDKISGPIELSDGTVYDVSPMLIAAVSEAHKDELLDRIAHRHIELGTFGTGAHLKGSGAKGQLVTRKGTR